MVMILVHVLSLKTALCYFSHLNNPIGILYVSFINYADSLRTSRSLATLHIQYMYSIRNGIM